MAFKIIIILCVTLFPACEKVQDPEQEKLFGIWYHSVEEQTSSDTLIFRPEGYELPPARGREKMEFKKNGDFIYYQIAPADGYLKLKGTFELKKAKRELIVFYTKDNQEIERHYKIIEVDENILKLKIIQN